MTLSPIPISRTLDIKLEIDWDSNGAYTDETGRVMSFSGSFELVPPNEILQGGKQAMQRATVILNNFDFRYSPYNTSSDIYTYLLSPAKFWKPVKFSINENSAGWVPLFTGFARLPEENYIQGTVTFQLVDLGELLRVRKSTGLIENKPVHELIMYYLSNVYNLVDGVHYVSPVMSATLNVPATLSPANTTIEFSWLDDEPIWDELVDIAQAAGGRIYINQSGKVVLDMGWTWFTDTLSDESLYPAHYTQLSPSYRNIDFFDEVIVEYAPRYVGNQTVVYTLDKAFYIYPGETETLTIKFQWPIRHFVDFTKGVTYKFFTPNGIDVSSSITVTTTISSAQQITLSIQNPLSDLIYIPPFKINGVPILGGPSNQVTKQVAGVNVGKRLEIRGNPNIQSEAHAQATADFLAWWYAKPRLYMDVANLQGKSARFLGQRVRVLDRPALDPTPPNITFTGIIVKLDYAVSVNPDTLAIRYSQNMQLLEDVFSAGSNKWFVLNVHSWGDSTTVLWP